MARNGNNIQKANEAALEVDDKDDDADAASQAEELDEEVGQHSHSPWPSLFGLKGIFG